jgi:hypothetical protein
MTDYGGDLVVGSDVRLARLGTNRSMHVMVVVVLCAGVGGSHFLWGPQLADVLEGSEVRGWADPCSWGWGRALCTRSGRRKVLHTGGVGWGRMVLFFFLYDVGGELGVRTSC